MSDGLNPDGTEPDLCEICGVDHRFTWADLSHGIIRLIEHAQERIDWLEYPVNGDMIARQRAGILGPGLLYSTVGPEEINWERIEEIRAEAQLDWRKIEQEWKE